MSEVSLLKIVLDGDVVAEATLIVHNRPAAWSTFLAGFPAIAHLVAGELFGTMHVACDEELQAKTPQTGITIELQSAGKPHLFVPQNGYTISDRRGP